MRGQLHAAQRIERDGGGLPDLDLADVGLAERDGHRHRAGVDDLGEARAAGAARRRCSSRRGCPTRSIRSSPWHRNRTQPSHSSDRTTRAASRTTRLDDPDDPDETVSPGLVLSSETIVPAGRRVQPGLGQRGLRAVEVQLGAVHRGLGRGDGRGRRGGGRRACWCAERELELGPAGGCSMLRCEAGRRARRRGLWSWTGSSPWWTEWSRSMSVVGSSRRGRRAAGWRRTQWSPSATDPSVLVALPDPEPVDPPSCAAVSWSSAASRIAGPGRRTAGPRWDPAWPAAGPRARAGPRGRRPGTGCRWS